jgi:hypothetical protein
MMDHVQAERELALERYLLGQLPEPDQDRFEEHYFSCTICAEEVKAGTAFVANLKAVFAETAAARVRIEPLRLDLGWRRWFAPPRWNFAPAAVAAFGVLAGIVGYQNLYQIPALVSRLDETAVVVETGPVHAGSLERGGDDVPISKSEPRAKVMVMPEWEGTYAKYRIDVRRRGGSIVNHSMPFSAPKGDLVIDIRTSAFEEGRYTLLIYGIKAGQSEGRLVGEVPIAIVK